ncbi:unnamed protein product [Bursaphelenchus okinawaensis]|uniref:Uncharacterized protein n=1 Tax=Bursaphelenchus okinawaensis TaxID=465554 RepID=A0A811LD69_9BILA|nr:unnamed protein product [Bursaphelenchus okinawaensis]CAG9120397.1 unnamed protein product [Bursaphelenchus okinawaensis]
MSIISVIKKLLLKKNCTLSLLESPSEALISDKTSNLRLQREFLSRVNNGRTMKIKKVKVAEPLLSNSFRLHWL